ncbi:MAG TPA: glycosyltransferase [Saprospiraceae bacterium]|nr:glycosyltransferase [Saprospiraceae bacterium]
MTIGVIWDAEYPKEVRIQSETETLQKDNVDFIIFCLAFDKKRVGQIEYDSLNGIAIHRYFVPYFLKKIQFLAYTNKLYHYILKKYIKHFIEKNQLEILHVHNMYALRAILMVAPQIKYIFDIHENLPECFKMYSHTSSLIGKMLVSTSKWKKYEKKYIEASLKTVVVTEEAALYYQQNYQIDKSKFIVCPNFVRNGLVLDKSHNKYFEVNQKFSDKFNILYIGDTGKRRGIYLVLEAIQVLKDKIPNINFIIIGKSKEDNNYKKLIDRYNINEFISFEGWQPEEYFPYYINISHIGLSPLIRNIHHDTTYANKLFQYMAFGLPMIVSDCDAQKNLVINNNIGLVHKAYSVNEFIDAVELLFNDTHKRLEMATTCIETFNTKFLEHIVIKELKDFYQSAN